MQVKIGNHVRPPFFRKGPVAMPDGSVVLVEIEADDFARDAGRQIHVVA